MEYLEALKTAYEAAENKQAFAAEVQRWLYDETATVKMPVSMVRWVPLDMVDPNDYNPNSVPTRELQLLARSVLTDGFTMPIVTVWDEEKSKYVIVDGFHRWRVGYMPQVQEKTGGMLPDCGH